MFINNAVSDKLKSINNISEIIKLLTNKPYIASVFKIDLISAINRISKLSDSDISIQEMLDFVKYFINYKEKDNIDKFDILSYYFNSSLINDKYGCLFYTTSEYRGLMMSLINKDTIISKEPEILKGMHSEEYSKMVHQLYQAILDVYLPAHNPEMIISEVINNFTLGCILNNNYNINTVFHAFDTRELISIIIQIYTDDAKKFEFFNKYLQLIFREYNFEGCLNDIIDRFSLRAKGNKEELRILASNIFILFDRKDNSNEFREFFDNVLLTYFNKDISCAFLRELSEIAYIDDITYTRNRELIELLYNSKERFISQTKCVNIIETEASESSKDVRKAPGKKDSTIIHDTQNKVYRLYKTYKNAEGKIDSQITKILQGLKKVVIGDVKSEVIEGKNYSAMSLLKKVLGTAAIFSYSSVHGVIFLLLRYALKKSTTISERKKIIMELESEIEIVTEKIEDARGEGNKQAKYSLMRTKTELTNALKRIKYGLEASERSVKSAKDAIITSKSK